MTENQTMAGVHIADKQLHYDAALPLPKPAADEVLIRVHSAGVNRADLFQVEGSYPPPKDASPLPGLEVSGTRMDNNEPVCALLAGGGYAQYALAKKAHCLPVPPGISLQDAAGLPEIYATIWLSLMQTAQLKAGESLLVHGGSSGIGSAAIQWARTLGVTVYATARTAEKCDFIRSLGGHAICYAEEDFVTPIKQAGGVDVVLDMVGGDYVARNMKCLRANGRLVNIALLGGAEATIPTGGFLLKNLSWHGVTLRARSDAEKGNIISALRKYVWPCFADGRLRATPDEIFPLDQAEKAHQRMRESLHCGKITLQVCPT